MVRACLELRRTDPVTLRHWEATREKFALDREALDRRRSMGMALRERAAELIGEGPDGEHLADRIVEAFYDGGDLKIPAPLRRRVAGALRRAAQLQHASSIA